MNVDDIQAIVDRAMILCGCSSEAELARSMGMLSQNFNQKKKRGTVQKVIARYLEVQGKDSRWVLTGQGEMKNMANAKGGDYVEILKRYIIRLEEENEKLKGELLYLREGTNDRRKSGAGT